MLNCIYLHVGWSTWHCIPCNQPQHTIGRFDQIDQLLVLQLAQSPQYDTRQSLMQQPINIWLDCDPGLDDCFAIVLAAGHPRLNLLGVSTSCGNTSVQNTTKNASDILHLIGKSHIPVYMGSRESLSQGAQHGSSVHGVSGLGGVQLASSLIVAITENSFALIREKIMQAKGKVVFLCTGALTNLALLLHTNPLIKDKISMVSIMGGAIGKGNKTPAAEFNIYYDPIAAKCVFDSKMNIVLVPLEVTHTAMATLEIRNKMLERKSAISRVLVDMLEAYKIEYLKQDFSDPPIHDPCAVFFVLEPQQFVSKPARVTIDTYPISRGRTNIDFSQKPIRGHNATVCTAMNVPRFWEVMLALYHDMIPSE